MPERGNIDMTKRPRVKTDRGIATVRSMSFQDDDGNEVLIPTVSDDGRIMSNKEAIDTYYKTGQHLGKFATVEEANAAGKALHESEEAKLMAPTKRRVVDFSNLPGDTRWTDPQLAEQLARQERMQAQKAYLKGSRDPAIIANRWLGLPVSMVGGTPVKAIEAAATFPGRLREQFGPGGAVSTGKDSYLSDKSIGLGNEGASFVMGGPPAPAGALAAGRSKAPGLLEKSSLSETLHMPISEMQATQVPTGELQPRKIIQPADLQGRTLIGEQSDRTQAGHTLTQVGGMNLGFPVDLEGGMNFTRAAASQGPDKGVWASDLGQIQRINKFGREIEKETGQPGIIVPTAMNPRGGDFSHMHADTILAQLPNAKIPKRAMAQFDARMRALHPGTWGTLAKPEELGLLFREPNMGNLRKDFVEQASLGEFTQKGFPDPGQTRFAAHDPDLLGLPTGASGHTFAELAPGAPTITNPAIPHGTYPTQTAGTYLGGFERPVPFDLMWRDFIAGKRAAGKDPVKDWRAFQIGNVKQPVDQQLVDSLSQYLERAGKVGP